MPLWLIQMASIQGKHCDRTVVGSAYKSQLLHACKAQTVGVSIRDTMGASCTRWHLYTCIPFTPSAASVPEACDADSAVCSCLWSVLPAHLLPAPSPQTFVSSAP